MSKVKCSNKELELEDNKKNNSNSSETITASFSHNCYGILLAAGQGSRLSRSLSSSLPKQFYHYCDKALWWHSLNAFSLCPSISAIVIVFNEEHFDQACKEVKQYQKDFSLPLYCVKGGKRRQDSVYNALKSLPNNCDMVAIHDTARPFIKTALISKLINTLKISNSSAVIPSLPLSDTVKEISEFQNHTDNHAISDISFYKVLSSPKRENLRTVQTPQIFYTKSLLKAHENLIKNNIDVTDDAMALELINEDVFCVEGDASNKKITYVEDLALLEEKKEYEYISTQGYDVHAYVDSSDKKARAFKLATVPIPTKISIKAHSDGDVLLHALMDALLALICAGDIGMHFPDKDNTYENISSAILLDKVMQLLIESKQHIILTHIDVTLIAQEPKISPYIVQIRKALAHLLALPLEKVSIKSTTEEKLGFTGDVKGIKASVIVSAKKEC